MIKNVFYWVRYLPSKILNLLTIKLRNINHGDNFIIRGLIFIRGKGKILIGNNVTINSCIEANPIGGDTRTILFIRADAILRIGNNVGISNSTFYSESAITVEDDVFIGNSCKIYDSNFHSIEYVERKLHKENVIAKPVYIKKDAFIGAHTIILKGVIIGEKSIVGAGSVVTKSIPDGEVWGGNPARFIKKIED